MDLEHERRLTEVEQRAKSNSHRLEKLEPIVEEIHTMTNTMVQLVQEVKHTNEALTTAGMIVLGIYIVDILLCRREHLSL